MANIRGFGDINANNRPAAGRGGFGGGGGGGGGGENGDGGGNDPNAINDLLGFNRNTGKDPRNENFFDMIHYSFTPALKWKSFTAAISLANVAIFVITFIASITHRTIRPN